MARKSRNPNHEGSRKVMPDGRITYKSMIGKDAAGKPKYLQVYQRKGETASELKERFERELERFTSAAAILQESPAMYEIVKKGADTSVNEFFCRYLEDFKKPAVKPSTYAYYQNILKSNITPLIGGYRLKDLRPMVLQNYIKELCDKGLSYRTVKGALQLVKSGLAEAVYNELLEKNPAENIKIPKKSESKEVKVFTREQQQVFMRAIKGHIYEAFFTMAITTGMRCGEILGLKWDNVDMENRRIRICENLTIVYDMEEGNKIYIGTPKSSAGIRNIPIPDNLAKVLRCHQAEQMQLFGGVEGFVFKTNQNQPYHSRSHFSKALKKICKENGLPQMNLHALRHPYVKLKLKILSAYFSRTFGAKVLDFPHDFNPVIGIYTHLFDKHIGKCLR